MTSQAKKKPISVLVAKWGDYFLKKGTSSGFSILPLGPHICIGFIFLNFLFWLAHLWNLFLPPMLNTLCFPFILFNSLHILFWWPNHTSALDFIRFPTAVWFTVPASLGKKKGFATYGLLQSAIFECTCSTLATKLHK